MCVSSIFFLVVKEEQVRNRQKTNDSLVLTFSVLVCHHPSRYRIEIKLYSLPSPSSFKKKRLIYSYDISDMGNKQLAVFSFTKWLKWLGNNRKHTGFHLKNIYTSTTTMLHRVCAGEGGLCRFVCVAGSCHLIVCSSFYSLDDYMSWQKNKN